MFNALVQSLSDDTLISLARFRPELTLCATIVLLLLARLVCGPRGSFSALIAFIGSAVGLWFAASPWITGAGAPRQEIFTGLLVYDNFTVFFRVLLLGFAVLFVLFTRLSGIPDREDGQDFYTLVLGGTLGMCLMASANHLLIIFLGVEMASVPSYALAGMLKGRRKSSEAALKYVVFGAGTAGVMLYGISLLAGVLGSVHLPTMAHHLAALFQSGQSGGQQLGGQQWVLMLGGLMVAVGLAFKLSAVPFHFWCPDVFEGASAEVAAFLSVASKAAALALLVRVVFGFGAIAPAAGAGGSDLPPAANAAPANPQVQFRTVAATQPANGDSASAGAAAPSDSAEVAALAPARNFAALLVAFLAAITCTFGNLAAYGQTNIKRLLAYSTIAHAGYMMMPVAAALVLVGNHDVQAAAAVSAMAFYAGIYLFMNLGAFMLVAFLRNTLRSEQIADYAGLIRRSPGVVVAFAIVLFALIGLPPFAGFSAKFAIFGALVRGMESPAAANLMLTLLVVGGVNTAISLFYYLRVVKVMTIDPEPENRLPLDFSLVSLRGALVVAVVAPVVGLGIWWNALYHLADVAAHGLLG